MSHAAQFVISGSWLMLLYMLSLLLGYIKLAARLDIHFPVFCLIFLLCFVSLLENLTLAALSPLIIVVQHIS